MGGDGLRLARLADHEELGQDGHRLQVDGERPQDLAREDGEGRLGEIRVPPQRPATDFHCRFRLMTAHRLSTAV